MILTKLMILTLIIANVLSMTKDFHLLILGQVITKTKLRMYFFCNLMFWRMGVMDVSGFMLHLYAERFLYLLLY
jgi:hypothetical protein